MERRRLLEEVLAAKRARNAVILVHNCRPPEIQEAAARGTFDSCVRLQ